VQHPHSLNHLLATLPQEEAAFLEPHLQHVQLPQEKVLFHVGDAVERVYFPHSGVISLVVQLQSGEMVESAMVGHDGIVGSAFGLAAQASVTKALVQLPGEGSTLAAAKLRQLANGRIAFWNMLFSHEQFLMAQAQQSAACNATHPIEARLARWLLRCRDLVGDDLPLTQEFISQMLGVQRTSVTMIARTLQQAGFIRYRRGHIRIVDVEGLQDSACECYATVRRYSERLRSVPSVDDPTH
jgi:CRP-like cAMP-binding protein